MDEFERRLRTSLTHRADDIEPSPELWLDVRARRDRRRRRALVVSVGLAAAAVLAAVVAVPTVVDAFRPDPTGVFVEPQPTVEPPARPTAQPTTRPSPTAAPLLAVPDVALATDGRSIFLLGSDGTRGAVLYEQPDEGENRIETLAVRPGSAPDDLTAVALTQGEGMYSLFTFRWDDERATFEAFPDPYQVERPQGGGSVPAPVWSPDGRHVMWIEDGAEGEPGLRAIGWSDGPGTGRQTDDNAAWPFDSGMPVFPAGLSLRLSDWVWTQQGGDAASGYVVARSVDPIDLRAWMVGLDRQSDGALALSSERATDRLPQDVVLGYANDGGLGPEYLLTVEGAGQGTLGLHLTWTTPGLNGSGELPVPAELQQGSDPTAVWMTALRGGVLLGKGGDQTAVITLDGQVVPVPGPVVYADFIG